MAELPDVTPAYAPQPPGVAWPTNQWPLGERSVALDAVVNELFDAPGLGPTNAVVVVRGGRIHAERYGGVREFFDRPAEPITAASPLLSWSMAKSMLHAVVGVLASEGRLDPDARAPVPEWADERDPRHAIRLADLLAMRDGLAFTEAYVIGEPSHVIEMLFGEGQRDMAAFSAAKPLAHAPGDIFNYSSGTSNVISRVVADEVGYGAAYDAFLHQRLFDRIGMSSATATFDDAGVWVASSYVHATALDFARFGLLYLRGGEWDGDRVLPREWVDTAQRPRSRDEANGALYSWHWWVTGDEYGTYWASGYEGQQLNVVPALDAVIVRLGHTPEELTPEIEAWRDRVIDVLAQAP